MKPVVFTRFSIPQKAGFRHATRREARLRAIRWLPSRVVNRLQSPPPETLEDLCAFLFAPERMAARFALFEAICLPSIAHQEPPGVTHVVIVSDLLPEEYLARLRKLRETYDFEIETLEAGASYGKLTRDWVARNMPAGGAPRTYVTARLDDDDGLGKRWASRLRDIAATLDRGAAVSFANGLDLRILNADVQATEVYRPFASMGLAAVHMGTDLPETIFNYDTHHCGARNRPCLLLSDPHSYLRITHAGNDSARLSMSNPGPDVEGTRLACILRNEFGVSLDDVHRLRESRI